MAVTTAIVSLSSYPPCSLHVLTQADAIMSDGTTSKSEAVPEVRISMHRHTPPRAERTVTTAHAIQCTFDIHLCTTSYSGTCTCSDA
jgi:hypothetical protein